MYAMYFSDGVFFSDRRSFPTKHDLDILRLLRWFFPLLETANHHVSPPFGRNIFDFFPSTKHANLRWIISRHIIFFVVISEDRFQLDRRWIDGPKTFLGFPFDGACSRSFRYFWRKIWEIFFWAGSKKQCKALNIYNVFPKKGIIMDYLYFHNPFLGKHFKIRKLRTTVFFWSKSFTMKPNHASPYLKVLQFLKALNIWVIYDPYKFSFFGFHGNCSQLKMVNDGRTENPASIEIIGDDGTRPQGRGNTVGISGFSGVYCP